MKKIIIVVALLLSGFTVLGKHFWRGELKSIDEVCSLWGTTKFEIEKFKLKDEPIRAKMACDLLRNQKKYIGKTKLEIRKEFGSHDGYYFTDSIPAYLIYLRKTKSEDSWQLVFLLDRIRKVSEIVVHKNCCDR